VLTLTHKCTHTFTNLGNARITALRKGYQEDVTGERQATGGVRREARGSMDEQKERVAEQFAEQFAEH
jgi:hypothetical protein